MLLEIIYRKNFQRVAVAAISGVVFMLPLWATTAFAQTHAPAVERAVTEQYAIPLSLFSDTVQESAAVKILFINWADTCFQLKRSFGKSAMRVNAYPNGNPHSVAYTDTAWYDQGYTISTSNCHSFGLAQSFAFAGIEVQPLFNKQTFVGKDALEIVLATVYKQRYTLNARSRKALKQEIPAGSLLVFRNKWGMAMHTAFKKEAGFYSKNGWSSPMIYKKLKHLREVYFDAASIEIYTLEVEKLNTFFTLKQAPGQQQ